MQRVSSSAKNEANNQELSRNMSQLNEHLTVLNNELASQEGVLESKVSQLDVRLKKWAVSLGEKLTSYNRRLSILEYEQPVKALFEGMAYHWRDWSVARVEDYLYIWSDAIVLRLYDKTHVFFSFFLNGKHVTMYPDSLAKTYPKYDGHLLKSLKGVRSHIETTGSTSRALFPPGTAKMSPSRLIFSNWSLFSVKDGELAIQNSKEEKTVAC